MVALPFAVGMLISPQSANGQWTVTVLHPPGASQSHGMAMGPRGPVGIAVFAGHPHGGMWTGPGYSWTDLHPSIAEQSTVLGYSGPFAVGEVEIDGVSHASLWTDSGWIDLSPPDATWSRANGGFESVQVGAVRVNGVGRATLWSGSAASRVDVHPHAAQSSSLNGAARGIQVGTAYVFSENHASLWHGTPDSWVDLHPSGFQYSDAQRAYGNQQVGYAYRNQRSRAVLWSGTADSVVDLTPVFAHEAGALDVHRGVQVGAVYLHSTSTTASLWSGSAESWEDLSRVLPIHFGASVARGVWSDDSYTYVAGDALNLLENRYEAILWSRPCRPAVIAQPESDLQVCYGVPIQMAIIPGGVGPFSYQWQLFDSTSGTWVDLSDGQVSIGGRDLGRFIGARTPQLSSSPLPGGSASAWSSMSSFFFRCVVGNSCGTVISGPAEAAGCLVDVTCDGFVDFFDYDDFVACFEGTGCGSNADADFNRDGFVDFFDYDDFVTAFEGGC